ncbi:unnamed protein product [Microthlaspi erraticum]|uniref:Uncharacterized protein n=1 Tax=Microthlaspi erraticum TaxID=1685480 RepID=A0A6D2IN76_9BRAS|nr:unnamed protein product [Microthlaspi erraticum]
MRIEGEKGVKTQSAPKHWPRTRKRDFGRAIPTGRPLRSSREGISRARPDSTCATETFARTHEPGKKRPRSAEILYRNGPTVPVDPGNKRSASAEISRPKQFGRPNRSTATKSIGHRPKTFLGQGTPMAKTKGNESMKKKKNPFMEPPKKQIKLGSSSSNARAAIPTSPHSIDAIKNMWRVQEEEKMIGHL